MSHNKKEKALVLGGLGLIGSSVVKELTKNFDVTVVDKRKTDSPINNVAYLVEDAFIYNNLHQIILSLKPRLIINAINIATIFSQDPEVNLRKLIKFYLGLYRTLDQSEGRVHYMQIGTTGSGGLGFNIPFTHGDKIEDFPIINKAAFAGVSDAMLTLLSRSFNGRIKVSEIKPGLSIFRKELSVTKYNGSNLVLIDGGESGFYSYDELALLTCYMGFTTVDTIVDKVLRILKGGKNFHNHCVYDTIGSLNGAIIKQNHLDHWHLTRTLNIMKRLSGKDYVIATGKLGPPSITRDLILSYTKKTNPHLEINDFDRFLNEDNSVKNTLRYIKENDPNLSEYLAAELNYENYLKLTCIESEPWKNVNSILSRVKVNTAN